MTMSSNRTRPRRFLLFGFSKFGLGHSARCAKLATALADAGASVVVAHDQPQYPMPQGVSAVLLPNWALTSDYSARFRVPTAAELTPPSGLSAEAFTQVRRESLLDIVEQFRPDWFYVDHFPFGRRNMDQEILPPIALARKYGARIASGFRGVPLSAADANDPFHVQRILATLRDYADAVIIFLPSEYRELSPPFLDLAPVPVHYVGFAGSPVGTKSMVPSVDVLATFGGGVDAQEQLECVLECANSLPAVTFRVSVGPHSNNLRSLSRPNLALELFISDLANTLGSARLYLGMSGYNTMTDIMVARKPCVLFPRFEKGREEQLIWANLLKRLGFARAVLDGAPYNASHIVELIQETVSGGAMRSTFPSINLHGAKRAADLLLR
jgi:predicted glycosyltransferase